MSWQIRLYHILQQDTQFHCSISSNRSYRLKRLISQIFYFSPAGNSLSAVLDGQAQLRFLNRNEDYIITMPYAHCKGIALRFFFAALISGWQYCREMEHFQGKSFGSPVLILLQYQPQHLLNTVFRMFRAVFLV